MGQLGEGGGQGRQVIFTDLKVIKGNKRRNEQSSYQDYLKQSTPAPPKATEDSPVLLKENSRRPCVAQSKSRYQSTNGNKKLDGRHKPECGHKNGAPIINISTTAAVTGHASKYKVHKHHEKYILNTYTHTHMRTRAHTQTHARTHARTHTHTRTQCEVYRALLFPFVSLILKELSKLKPSGNEASCVRRRICLPYWGFESRLPVSPFSKSVV